ALLRKRILFYSLPPVRRNCYNVFCTSILASTSTTRYSDDPTPPLPPTENSSTSTKTGSDRIFGEYGDEGEGCNPLYFVNVADIGRMMEMRGFVGCTTESIFQLKQTLYDIYIHHRQFIFGTLPPRPYTPSSTSNSTSPRTHTSDSSSSRNNTAVSPTPNPSASQSTASGNALPDIDYIGVNIDPKTRLPARFTVNEADKRRFEGLKRAMDVALVEGDSDEDERRRSGTGAGGSGFGNSVDESGPPSMSIEVGPRSSISTFAPSIASSSNPLIPMQHPVSSSSSNHLGGSDSDEREGGRKSEEESGK
ncbi:hypothetical protein HK102_006907, partial [Quaeritorhiza haematococci]